MQFGRNTSQKIIAEVAVKPAGIRFEAEVFLGLDELTKVATSDRSSFSSSGLTQTVRLPVIMPPWPGRYKVFLHLYSGGQPFAEYRLEDVQIF